MITGSVGPLDRLDELVQQLAELAEPDLMPLALEVRDAVIEGNAEGLLAGLDADGNPMADLKESTYKRGRGGLGPPTVPRFGGSQLIDRFRATIEANANGGFRIKAGWPGVPQVKYLNSRATNRDGSIRPARKVSGIRPATRQKIREIVAAYKRKLRDRRK